MGGTYHTKVSRIDQAHASLAVLLLLGDIPHFDQLVRSASSNAAFKMGINVDRGSRSIVR